MQNDTLGPTKYKGNYCDQNGIIIEGTKHKHPRGYTYDLVVILENNEIIFAYEEGNYAGGITLQPQNKNYKISAQKKLERFKRDDPEFYYLITNELVKKKGSSLCKQ